MGELSTFRHGIWRPAAVVAAAALTVAACAQGGVRDAAPSNLPGLQADYDVTYTDGTAVIEPERVADQLISTSEDGRTFRFNPTDELRSLEPGQVAILGGVGFGRVSAVREEGGELVAETTESSLGEAIENGTISWEYEVDWTKIPEESFQAAAGTMASALVEKASDHALLTLPLKGAEPVVLAVAPMAMRQNTVAADSGLKEGFNYSGTVKGWDVAVSLTPATDRLNLELTASHKLPAGTKAVVGASGWVSGFTQETLLSYENSTATQLTSRALGVESELELTWTAVKLGEAFTAVTSFKLPVSVPIPFMVGPIPVVISVGGNLQVVPELSSDDAFSSGSYKVKYRSDQGFEITGSQQSALGELLDSDIGVSGETLSGSSDPFLGIVAFGLGVEFPRMELSILGTTSAFITLKTFSTSQWSPGTVLSDDLPPCQKGTTSIAAYAGYSLKVLGFTLGDKTEELWKTEHTKYKDDEPCD